MNGRLRQLPSPNDAMISIVPLMLPSGIITTHQVKDLAGDGRMQRTKTHCSLFNLKEMHRRRGESVIDHCWCLLPSYHSTHRTTKSAKTLNANCEGAGMVLAILTRGKGSIDTICSSVHIYYRSHSNLVEESEREKMDVDNCYPFVKTLSFCCICNGISMDRELLAVSSLTGILVYNLFNIISVTSDEGSQLKQPIELLRGNSIHAMDVTYPYLTAASGGTIGIWRIENLETVKERENDLCLEHIWTYTIQSIKNRITCIQFLDEGSGLILAVACWDGSAFVFARRSENANDDESSWVRVGPLGLLGSFEKPESSHSPALPLWEIPVTNGENVFPTFLVLGTVNEDTLTRTFLVVSNGKHSAVRCFDLDVSLQCHAFELDTESFEKDDVWPKGWFAYILFLWSSCFHILMTSSFRFFSSWHDVRHKVIHVEA
jgi:hypothetical protein